MPVSAAERQFILSQITSLAANDLALLWQRAGELSDLDFAQFVAQAFPELVDPYAALASEAAALWYDETPSTTAGFVAGTAPLPPVERLTKSAEWALAGLGAEGLDRLQGTLQRAIFDAARETTILNTNNETGSRWARHASANACAFCAMLATRGAVFVSEKSAVRVVGAGKDMTESDRRIRGERTGIVRNSKHQFVSGGVKPRGGQSLGDKYHDHCHCVAIEVRPGGNYQPPDYVSKWEDAYIEASRAARTGEYGAIDVKAVLAHMRESLGTH
ncbi:VG15 protein [Mycobacteroides abscessus]